MNPLLRGEGGGGLFIIISSPFFFGGGGEGGLIEIGDGDGGGGGLFNLEASMVSVLRKELEYKVEKLKYKKF